MSDMNRAVSQPPEDWDRSEGGIDPTIGSARIAFPSGGVEDSELDRTPKKRSGKRTLSELLKLHAEKGTDVHFTAEEAARLEEVLGQWINSGCSPYESEDDFFSRSQDDSQLSRRSPALDPSGRPRDCVAVVWDRTFVPCQAFAWIFLPELR
ncbi:hypothetical protein FA95DRAFT_1568857 [Auriscalpium vulgare]|uniref:Uncharacterized protein n=1 Tax=Auriscalpium vulgare TaxID=40419 RepID=A0ACB8SAM2_9AGAM|nr:hypothetical protein FA95DRAFT_1568857 [Auriscalpium vulgare]